ncbi:hypothetical protein BDV93DRAFT_555590 [Ceratobasidium sp. AG-I]|nr:hypothetical protein BDV93DRAFT_555590 [Ceratobasidium sp. AG-I]
MHPLEHRPDPVFHALFVSDVLYMICDLLEVSDWMSLMLTCKSTFATAASHIWANLDGVHILTDLLVEGTEKTNSNKVKLDPVVDFSRFDVYAPWVRYLRVYGRTSKYLRGEYRRRCAQRSQQSSLFPKLESITMHTSDLHHDSDALVWVDILAAPTLAELRVVPIEKVGATAFVSFTATTKLSQALSESGPNIKRLEFYPSSAVNNSDDDEISDMLWKSLLGKSFESFVGLREITSSVLLIDRGGLAILGALPCLEKLLLKGCDECPQDLELSIPDSSFPALTHMSLLEIDADSLLALMSTSSFVQRLTSISLSQRFYLKNPYDEGAGGQDWLSQKLPLFLRHTSSLKRFTYNAREIGHYGQQHSFDIENLSLLRSISVLQLEHISLFSLSFPPDFPAGLAAGLQVFHGGSEIPPDPSSSNL